MPGAYDVIVIGGGIAGVSVAAELAADRDVVLLEMERTLAFHTTGRSAAMFLETYGGPAVRALTVASRPAFEGLLTPMPALFAGRSEPVRVLHETVRQLTPDVQLLTGDEAAAAQPLLRADRIELALLEPGAMEIDVHRLHDGFVHTLRARGGKIVTASPVTSARFANDRWTIRADDDYQAPVVVNAAGAWADAIAAIFHAEPVGLRALRRTAFMVDAPPGTRPPMVSEIEEAFYLKPDAGRLLCSPADETPVEPGDARPDEREIARAIEAINELTTLDVRHVRTAWAGLRTFTADRAPAVGYDDRIENFFWLAGQGGYGIQTAPALARTAAALVRRDPAPDDVLARGLELGQLSPLRLR